MTAEATYVSTGQLPPAERVRRLVDIAYERFRGNADGALSDVYPSLAAVAPDTFGICVANTSGATVAAGDSEVEFTIMSVAKPFVLALMGGVHTPERVLEFVGGNATGRRFNAVSAIEDAPDGRTNPMVNPGAIATASMTPGSTTEEKWELLRQGLSRFAGRELSLDDEVFASASAANAVSQRRQPRDRRCYTVAAGWPPTRARPSTCTRVKAHSRCPHATSP